MVTKTIGKIHFNDLDHVRFEHLCLSLIYTYQQWNEVNHYGEVGKDDGIDIYATNILENGKVRKWAIQCKRYSKFTAADAKCAVNEILERNDWVPDVLMLMISCNPSKRTIEAFRKYAEEQNIRNPILMTSSVIEAELYSKRHDLLFAYFGIDLLFERRNTVEIVKRKIRMKRRFTRAFRNYKIDFNNQHLGDNHKYSKVAIHSIDDSLYPNIDKDSFGISSWYVPETFDFYNDGFEVIIGFSKAIIYGDLSWELVLNGEEKNESVSDLIVVGRIPYTNIIDFDLDGDDYYSCPHIYCDFACNGTPYEEIMYHPHRDDRFLISKYLEK